MSLLGPEADRIIDAAIQEDLGWGDITTQILIPPHWQAQGTLVVKADGIIAGMDVAQAVFLKVDPSLIFSPLKYDGTRVAKGAIAGKVRGSAASILKAERTALNFLQRLSGIATLTARLIEAVAGLKTRVTDTRKTTPGFRYLEKYAVRMGGAVNHRQHLGDGILIKDNHLAALKRSGLSLAQAVQKARAEAPHTMKIEVEVTRAKDAVTALKAGADIILLDNMSVDEMKRAVQGVKGRALLEASGGITLDNVRQIAETGVDIVSVGALTHSAKALDISLELEYD